MAANLTDISVKSRKGIRYGIYLVIFLVILRVAFGFGKGIFQRINPPKPPPPDVRYDVLPEILFPEQNRQLPELTYTLETVTGDLPVLSDRAKIYLMPQASADLFSLDRAIEKARGLGYTGVTPIEKTETVYRFNHRSVPASLEINVITGVFTSSYVLDFDPTPLDKSPPDPGGGIARARSLLARAKSSPKDISEGPAEHEYLSVEGRSLVSALSQSEADLIRVNMFRKSYDELPSVTSNPKEANVWFILSGSSGAKEVIASQFHYFPVDEEEFATYPIKTAQVAFEELVGGRAYVADLGINPTGDITIQNVYLAYYDPDVFSLFYQPVLVFEGANGFVAYVPTITDQYYGGETETPEPSPVDVGLEAESETSSQE